MMNGGVESQGSPAGRGVRSVRGGRGGRGGNRTGRGGRGGSRSRVTAACRAATAGWKVQQAIGGTSICMENDFTNSILSEKTRRFVCGAMERVDQSLLATGVSASRSRASFIYVMVKRPLELCRGWLNEHIRIHSVAASTISSSEMLRWFAMMLMIHSSSYPPEISLDILSKFVQGDQLLTVNRYR